MSGGILERGDFVRGGYVLGGYCPGGYCPGGYCPRTVGILVFHHIMLHGYGKYVSLGFRCFHQIVSHHDVKEINNLVTFSATLRLKRV